jgi:hypothetical protein
MPSTPFDTSFLEGEGAGLTGISRAADSADMFLSPAF